MSMERSLTGKAREGEVRNNAEMDRRVKAIAERNRREGHTGEVTIRFVDPATLPPSKVMAFKEKVCALPSCSERFVPTGARQKYHTKECAAEAKRGVKADARRARAAEKIKAREAARPPTEAEDVTSDRSPEVAEPGAIAEPGESIADDLEAAERRLRAEHPPTEELRDRYTELLFSLAEDQRDRGKSPSRHVLDRLERLVDAGD